MVGFIDLTAGHLKKSNTKVGAYGCGLYDGFKPNDKDIMGVITDPICKQYQRKEAPNIHILVETLTEDNDNNNDDDNDNTITTNSVAHQFTYVYTGIPNRNTSAIYPYKLIHFALTVRRTWSNLHLVNCMIKPEDFTSSDFIGNVSVVVFIDGVSNDTSHTSDVENSIT